jgi:hypothetical protein
MNEAAIMFVCTDVNHDYTYTKVVRVEFEGSPEQFLDALNAANGTMREGAPEAFNIVATEILSA